MTLDQELNQLSTLFIDTAPVIYYIEAHPQYGPLVKKTFDTFLTGPLTAFTSVITLAEVLPKPVQAGDDKLARKFAEFLRDGKI